MKIFYYVFLILIISSSSFAQENQQSNSNSNEFLIQIKNHKFYPDIIKVKENVKFKLIIENLDSTVEEFESDDLKKEKLIQAGKSITIPIKGLSSGEYKFYGDFHQKTAQGKIVVK